MFLIRKANENDLAAVLNILNAATEKLLAKGVMQWELPWDKDVILKDISDGLFYLGVDGEQEICCLGLKKFEINPFNCDGTGMYAYHLAVHPQYSGKGYSTQLCSFIHNYAKENGTTVYFDCWAGNDFLKKFYTSTGFEYMGDYPEEDYFVSAFKTR